MPTAAAGANAVGAQLWALCSRQPFDSYGPPWDRIAKALWVRLVAALGPAAALRAAETAARASSYKACAAALIAAAPPVHRVLADIRGLALASATAVEAAAVEARPKTLPGQPLVYETLPMY